MCSVACLECVGWDTGSPTFCPGAQGHQVDAVETPRAKEARGQSVLSGKTPRLPNLIGSGQGLKCGLSGNLVLCAATARSNRKGKPPVR